MIESIRSQLKSRGAQLILWLTLLSLAGGSLFTIVQSFGKHKADSIGTVDNQDIGYLEYRRKVEQMQQMVREARKMYGQHADMLLKMWGLDKNPHEAAMEELIAQKAFQAAADSTGAHVSKEYMYSKLRDPYFVREYLGNLVPQQAVTKQGIDVAALKYNLERLGLSEEEFEEQLNESMKRALFQQLLLGGLYAPKALLREVYAAEFLKRNFAILTLPFDMYLKNAQAEKLTESELGSFYDKHKDDYRIPEKRSAKVYAFEPATYGIAIDDKELESAYHKRKMTAYVEKPEERSVKHIELPFTEAHKVEVRAQAQEILKAVKAQPDSFEKIAQEKSVSKDKGASIVLKKNGDPAQKALEKAAFDLDEVGEISPVVDGKNAFHILKLERKIPAVYKPLDKVKDQLLTALKAERFRTEFNANAPRIVSQASDLPEVWTKFIADHKGQASTVSDLERTGTQQGAKLFGLQKVGDRAFYVEGNKGYMLELTAITPSVLQPLTAVKEKVTQQIYKDRASKALETDLSAAREKIVQGKETIDAVAKSLKGSVEVTGMIDPRARDSFKKFADKGVPMDKAMGLAKVHAVLVDSTPKNGYLMQVKEIEPFNEADFEKKRATLEYEVRKQEESGIVPAFLEQLRKKADVKIKEEFSRQMRR